MAYLLAVETATKVCSVAVFENEQLLGVKEEHGDYSHSENLAVFADELIKECGLEMQQLDAIVVSKGPGSYTGLRIGVSFAKGLCYSLQIPLISIETLKGMAWGLTQEMNSGEESYWVCPMIDARRMEVYASIYDEQLNEVKEITAEVIDTESYSTFLEKQKIYFVGDGANKCKNTLQHSNADFSKNVVPSASYLGALGFEKFKSHRFEDVAYFEPFYLKEFIALKGKKLV